jgi:hypothetical protein
MEVQAKRQAFANAQGLEGMRGGFFENAKGRDLTNAGLNKDWKSFYLNQRPGMLNSLADMLKWAGQGKQAAVIGNADRKRSLATENRNVLQGNFERDQAAREANYAGQGEYDIKQKAVDEANMWNRSGGGLYKPKFGYGGGVS